VANGIAGETARVLHELLLNELDRRGAYKVISSSDVADMLGLEKLKLLTGCIDDVCVTEIGGALGVRFMLSGSVGRLGDELIVSLKIMDTDRQEIVQRAQYAIAADERLYARGVKVAVAELLGIAAEADQPPVPITFVVAPAGSRLEVDGHEVDPALSVAVQPGLHVATVSSEDYETVERRFEVLPGPEARVEITLSVKLARLSVTTVPPGALIRLNGKPAGRSHQVISVAPGKHTLELELDGFYNDIEQRELRPGAAETLSVVLREGYSDPQLEVRRRYRNRGLVLTSLALAAGGIGAWQGLTARKLDRDLEQMTYGTPEATKTRADQRRAAYIADAVFATSAILLTIAVYELWHLRD